MDRVEAEDQQPDAQEVGSQPAYDFHFGETDLAETHIRWRGSSYFVGGILLLAALGCVGVLFVGSMRFITFVQALQGGNQALTQAAPFVTTPPPVTSDLPTATLFLPTVTADAPPTRTMTPTATITPTPGPCMQTVQAGDSLIGLVSRCGHRDLDIINVVLELNNLDAAEFIQEGQTLEIPWPTETPDAAPPEETEADEAVGEAVIVASMLDDDTSIASADASPVETLQAGVIWHQVVKDETVISIAFQYGADLKILSELNPEVAFSQCDFGQFSGGPSCVVNLFEGQRVRVPAPTATPTLSPTPSGSETPTPTPTATFNAPTALSPSNLALFQREQLVTLRWVASGTLASNQVYQVNIEDVTSGEHHTANTTELFFIMPEAWQGRDEGRHEYRWSVSVIDVDNADDPYFTTEPRSFTWESVEDATS